MTWTAPASNGGSAITGYVVTPYLDGTTAQTAQTFNSTATTETVTGLTNGGKYTFKVAAINGRRYGHPVSSTPPDHLVATCGGRRPDRCDQRKESARVRVPARVELVLLCLN